MAAVVAGDAEVPRRAMQLHIEANFQHLAEERATREEMGPEA